MLTGECSFLHASKRALTFRFRRTNFQMTAPTQRAVSAIVSMIYYSIRLGTLGESRMI